MAKASKKATRKPAKKRAASAPRRAPEMPHTDDHIDGCDVEFTEAEATPDEDLPPARGGVEVVAARSRARRG